MIYINLTLDAYNIIVGILLFISICLRHIVNDKVKAGFIAIVILNVLMASSHILTLLFEGNMTASGSIILQISTFVFYFMSFTVLVASGIEIIFYLNLAKYRKAFLVVVPIFLIVYNILLFITPFKGFLYSINSANIIERGSLYTLGLSFQVILYLNCVLYLILNSKSIKNEHIVFLLAFMLVPLIMQFVQIIVKEISLTNTGYTISFLIMFIHSNQRLEENLDNIEYELEAKDTELHDRIIEIEHSKLEFIKMQNHTIESLSNLVENRDEDTGEHVRRTREYVELLAVQLMKNGHYLDILTPRYVRFLKRAAPMHDIGKIVVPDSVLKKPERLTPEEFIQMKRHASEGGRIVHEIFDGYEDPEYIKITSDIATHHHEKWDGSGYPDNLKGDAIPLSARIMAIADVFDALVSPRIYKSPMSYEDAFALIKENSGIHFDPIIAQEFLNIKEKAAAINESYRRVD